MTTLNFFFFLVNLQISAFLNLARELLYPVHPCLEALFRRCCLSLGKFYDLDSHYILKLNWYVFFQYIWVLHPNHTSCQWQYQLIILPYFYRKFEPIRINPWDHKIDFYILLFKPSPWQNWGIRLPFDCRYKCSSRKNES